MKILCELVTVIDREGSVLFFVDLPRRTMMSLGNREGGFRVVCFAFVWLFCQTGVSMCVLIGMHKPADLE